MIAYRETVIGDGCSAYWRLNEEGFVDPSGAAKAEVGPNADYVGTPTLQQTPGLVRTADKAIRLNGSNQAVTIADSSPLGLGDTLSLECWFKLDVDQTGQLIHKGAGAYTLSYKTTDKKLYFGKSGGNDIVKSSVTVNDGAWHHVVISRSDAGTKLYLDGVDRTTAVNTDTLTNNSSPLGIGRQSGGGSYFSGWIDEVALYKELALTDAQAKAHYDAGTIVGNMADLVFEVAFTTDPGDASPAYVNITEYVKDFGSERGREYEFDRIQTGKLDVTLLNTDSRFDPTNSDSPYYPYVLPLRKVRLSADWNRTRYPVFTGYVERWPVLWAIPSYSEVKLTVVDAFSLLQRAQFPQADYLNAFGTWNNATQAFVDDLSVGAGGYAKQVYIDVTTAFADQEIQLTVLYLNQNAASGGRTVTDGQTNIATTQITSASAAFTQADVGRLISGSADIPANSYIKSVDNATTIQINQNLTGTNSGQTLVLSGYFMREGKIGIPAWAGVGSVIDMEFQIGDTGCRDVIAVSSSAGGAGACTIKGKLEMFVQDASGSMMDAMLDAIGWSVIERAIDAGQSNILPSTPEFEDALPFLQSIVDGELGLLFVAKDGYVTFQQRNKRFGAPYTTSQGTFGDGGGSELPYAGLDPDFDYEKIYNEINVTRTVNGAVTKTASDATSKTTYGRRSASLTPPLTSDSEAQSMATYLLSILKDPALRFRALTIAPQADPTNLWPQVLGREISDRITIKRRPPGAALINRDGHIERISHQGTPAKWTTTFQVSPVVSAPGY